MFPNVEIYVQYIFINVYKLREQPRELTPHRNIEKREKRKREKGKENERAQVKSPACARPGVLL